MATDDKAPNPAPERMKTVGVELLGALSSRGLWRTVFGRAPTPLVPATSILAPETQRDSEPEARAHPVLQVGEPSCDGRGGSEEPRPSTWTSARPHPGPRFRPQRGEEAGPAGFRTPSGEVALTLGKSRGGVFPTPGLRRRFPRHRTDLV